MIAQFYFPWRTITLFKKKKPVAAQNARVYVTDYDVTAQQISICHMRRHIIMQL